MSIPPGYNPSTKVYNVDGKNLTVDTGGNLNAANGQCTLPVPSQLAAAGKNGAGAITLAGALVGSQVYIIFGAPTAGGTLVAPAAGTFESTISVAGEIQQISSSNLSGNTYVFILNNPTN